jgi:thiosulfate dehydrogenase [quinone] large subunit
MRETVHIEEPPFAKWLFAGTQAAWLWLLIRLWLGYQWITSGFGKVFGEESVGWIRSGTVVRDGQEVLVPAGGAVRGFAIGAIERSTGDHPAVAFGWYVNFLEFVRDSAYSWLGPLVAVGEVVIGIAILAGMFTGIAAFLGATLNFSFMLAGSAGVNPMFFVLEVLLVLAWRNAGWIGLDRYLLPKLGVPWRHDYDLTIPAHMKVPEPSAT